MYKYILFASLLFLAYCSENTPTKNKAFYYWNTFYGLDSTENKIRKELDVEKFYVRFLDVDWSITRNEAIPVGELHLEYGHVPKLDYVPCVFITNTVMLESSKGQLDTLAFRLNEKIMVTVSEMDRYLQSWIVDTIDTIDTIPPTYKEIQIDCDWTENSKENYFYFLEKMKDGFPDKSLSATLRLWQLKYRQKAGVPPVDKVMLMCYSTGDPKQYDISNSIATYNDISKYIQGQSYRLPVDIALPIYSWAVLFKNQQFKSILRNIDVNDIKSDTSLYGHIKGNRYFFKSDTVMANTYIRYGDEIRLESLPVDDMPKLIGLLKEEGIYSDNSTVSFFAWDTTYINNYGKDNIKGYFNRFH